MQLVKTVEDLTKVLERLRRDGSVGLVPTMGALHAGHLSLIAASKRDCAVTVASIFVNPTQFNQSADLDTYPRTPGRDVRLLEGVGCDLVFMPTVEAVYPPDLDTDPNVQFGNLETVMEGAERPGHFAGVAQVIHRLLDIVQPDAIFMGQKDYQQVAIVRELMRQTGRKVELVSCPIVREPDGLAMSSRNLRLSEAMRATAPLIQKGLQTVVHGLPDTPITVLTTRTMQEWKTAGLRPEYLSVAHPDTLQPLLDYTPSVGAVVCAAAWAGDVRLIDNVLIPGQASI